MANKVKEAWAADKPIVNGWLSIPNAFSAEVMAQAGFDSLTVDMQHGVQDYMSTVACFQGIQAHGGTPFVRVPWNEPGIIGKVLDAGAKGVICPMVNTAEQAAAFVSYCRYPPLGARSFGPIRSGMYGVASDTDAANRDVVVMAMIETREAVANLEAILDTPGLDAVYIGPSDLGLSHGLAPTQDREEPEILAIFERVLKETKKRGQFAGIHTMSGKYSKRAFGMGFRFATIQNDAGLMLNGAKAQVADTK